jgi:glutathione peroxidase
MRNLLLFFAIIASANISSAQKKSFYDFKAKDIDGNEIEMKKYKGKKVLIVNVASLCGYTPQYKELEWLHKNYKDSNLVILGFPCNDFSEQEPKGEKEIKTFCQKNYGVTFQMMSKISVKGNNVHPLYNWLQHKSENGVQDNDVKWNFNKFMISDDGTFQGYLPSKILPNDRIIIDWIMDR